MKRWISLFLVVVMILGTAGLDKIAMRADAATATSATATDKVLSEELEGYRRITMEDYGVTTEQHFTTNQEKHAVYMDFDKTYLDVDLNFHWSTNKSWSARQFMYQGDTRYTNNIWLCVDGTSVNLFKYDEDTNNENIAHAKGSDYGISSFDEYFNVKIRTDIAENAEDNTKEDMTIQLWVNDKFAYEGTITQPKHNRDGLYTQSNGANDKLSVKTPKVLEEELEGYQRITTADYGLTGVKDFEAGGAATMSNAGFNKAYLDADVNFNWKDGNEWHTKLLMYQGEVKYTNNLVICVDGVSVYLMQYDASNTISTIATAKGSDYGISSFAEYFNIKIRTDITANASDSNKEDVTIQLWVNNQFAYEGTVTQVKHGRSGLYTQVPSGDKLSVRASKSVDEELEGYRQITMADYGVNIDPETGVTEFSGGVEYFTKNIDFDKTYLDVDVNFNWATGDGPYQRMLMYQAGGRYTNNVFLHVDESDKTVNLKQYAADTTNTTIAKLSGSDYGIDRFDEYFNVKIRTDIAVNESDNNKEDVKIQLWLNNKLAYEGIITQAKHDRSGFYTAVNSGKKMSVRIPIEPEKIFDGYKRLTFADFEGLKAPATEGVVEALDYARSGQYRGVSMHKTYLDTDIRLEGAHFNYLSNYEPNKEVGYWSSDGIRFLLDNNKLSIRPVVNQNYVGYLVQGVDLSSYGVTASEHFNLKVKTDVMTNAEDATKTDAILQVWVNNKFVGRYIYTSTTHDMTVAGIYANVSVKTPVVCKELQDETYNLSKGKYLLSGADSFRVNGSPMSVGDTLNKPGDYVIESLIGTEVASIQRVSLYHLGDVDLDGVAFENSTVYGSDYYKLASIVKYGTDSKASLKAADMNNDGGVTQADLDAFASIYTNATSINNYFAKYHPTAVTYDYLGGDEVMPIGGYFGPYSAKTTTDEIYQWIKESGINIIVSNPIDYNAESTLVKQGLKIAEEHGLGIYLKDSVLNTLTVDESDKVTNHTYKSTAKDIAERISEYSMFKSFLGISIVDEPLPRDYHDTAGTTYYQNKTKYEYYEGFAEALKPYVNLAGYINAHGRLAIDSGYLDSGDSYATAYEKYLSEIAPDVDMLSFDSYLYFEKDATTQKERLNNYLVSLDTVRKVAEKHNIPFWSFAQAGCDFRDDKSGGETKGTYTKADTLWIVNTSLAYGAKGIEYFPLLQPEYFSYVGEGTYDFNRNGIIGANGKKNNNYAFVQQANKQIAAIDEVLMKASSKGVVVTGEASTDVNTSASTLGYTFSGIINKSSNKYTAKLANVTSSGTKGAMVGCFDYRDSEAYYVVNYDRSVTQNITLTFNGSSQYRIVQDAKTTYGTGNSVTLTIPAGEGVLVVLEDHVVEYTKAQFATYRTGEEFRTPDAPVGYVFAGWFLDEACTKSVAKNATTVTADKVYAKFVDQNLLQVKAQIPSETSLSSTETDIRFAFAVDSLDYAKVGFVIKQGSKVRERSNNKVYEQLSVYYEGTSTSYTPKNVFCETATKFKTWTLYGVPYAAFDDAFEVTAFWITKDGTRVSGPTSIKNISEVIR